MLALLPPDGGAGNGLRKEFPVGAVFWMLIYWGGPLQFVKIGGGGMKYQEG